MKLHLTLRNIFVILLFLCMQPFAFAESQHLTEEQIQSFMKTQDEAYIRRDATAWLSTLSDDYAETINLPPRQDQPAKVLKRKRSDAEATAVKYFPTYSDVKLSHEDRKINISQDGKSATVSQKNNITWTRDGKSTEGITLTTDTYELRGEKIVEIANVTSFLAPTKPNVWDVAERPTDCTYFPEDERVDQYDISQHHSKSTLTGLFGLSNPVPICRMYKADAKTVSAIIQSIVVSLGNPIRVADIANGVFTTDTMERSAAMIFKWQDSYSITAQEATGVSTVRILRSLGVYQSGKGFEQNTSDGYNEKWILSQITERLASGKYAAAQPSASTQTSAPAGGTVSVEDQLKKLQDMHDRKIISDEEYKAMRAKALGL